VTVTRMGVPAQQAWAPEGPPRQPPPSQRLTRAARHAATEDAKLLAALRLLFSNPSVYPRVIYLALGFTAITSLAFAYAEALPLPRGLRFVVLPAAAVLLVLSAIHPAWGRRALLGLVAGVIATGVYDLLRLGLVWAGFWGDPIPGIGRLALADPSANAAWGYVWRFVGNGGGMGMAFAMLPWRGVRSGILYGTTICLGLLGLLYVFPIAQVHFFPLTPLTAAGAMAGHWVYGAVLGALTARWLPSVGKLRRRSRARRRMAERPEPTLVAVPDAGAPRRPRSNPRQAPPTLTPQQLRDVTWALRRGPRAHGFPSDRWTLVRVAMVVERVTGVTCTQASELRSLLHAIGWRPTRRQPSRSNAMVG
jgi:hypothetical protein